MPLLSCFCCNHEEWFDDPEKAFHAGWDAPPHFSYVACPLCPAVCAVLGEPHIKAHAHWAEHGRPAEFNHLCLPDDQFASHEYLDKAVEGGKQIAKMIGALFKNEPNQSG